MLETNQTADAPRLNAPAVSLPVFLLVLVIFLFSGLSALLYEVIWTRVLLNIFGATLYAVSTVLAAYMGGLALGSWVGGKAADRLKRPLFSYGILEIVIALTALAVPSFLGLFNPIYDAVYASGSASFMKLSLIRFALSFCVLMVPTTCMGATLPLLSRFVAGAEGKLASRIGGLYAVNTTGAVLGAFLSGFVFIAVFGTHGTMYLGAALSILAGLASIVLSLSVEKTIAEKVAMEQPQEETAPSGTTYPAWYLRMVLLTYAISGFAALSYQVLWTRTLVFRFDYLKNTTYSFSAMLTVFLSGLALGSAFMASRVERQRDPARLYGLIQLLTGLSGAFSLFMLIKFVGAFSFGDPFNTKTQEFNWLLEVSNVFLRTVLVLGLPTFLMGMAFPVVARLCVRQGKGLGSSIGRLYALNTVGAILGSFCAGFVLIPLMGLAKGLLFLGMINAAIGILTLVLNPADTGKNKILWSVVAAVALVLFMIRLPQNYYFQSLDEYNTKMVAYKEGPLTTASVVENSIGYRTIYVDNVGVAGTDRILMTDQKSLAHVPALFLKNPKSALTVGFGSGGASWSYLQYKEFERVDCIEIAGTMPELADVLKDSNHGLLNAWDKKTPLAGQKFHNGRYQVILDDARSYLRFTKQHYDVIATDCTDLRYKSNANLYDEEYFKLCKNNINDDGMVVVWMPLGGMSPEVFACAMKTFAAVFPDMTIWYMNNEPTHYLLLIGTKQPLKININRMLERIQRPEVQADLVEVSLQQPEKILSCFLESAELFKKDWAAAPLNTELFPHLEFESPKFGYGDEPLLTNLESLRAKHTSVVPYLEDASEYPEVVKRVQNFEKATDAILAGHANLRRMRVHEAALEYLKAFRITDNEDESVRHLLSFDDIRRRCTRSGDDISPDVWHFSVLAEAEYTVGMEYRRMAKDETNPSKAAKLNIDSNTCLLDAANRYNQMLRNALMTDSQLSAQLLAGKISAGEQEGVKVLLNKSRHFKLQAILGIARCYMAYGSPDKAHEHLEHWKVEFQNNEEFAKLCKEAQI
jgi:spermidine synthase